MDENFESIRKYNFWGGTAIDCGVARPGYTGSAMRYLGARLVKVLTGQRRVGKSYILRQMAQELIASGVKAENVLMVNCELAAFGFLRTASDLNALIARYREAMRPQGCVYVMIDEVQEIEGWERVVNSLSQDCVDRYEVVITGSNSKMLSSELSTLLSGRYVEIPVFPLSYEEYARFRGLALGRQSFIDYMQDGGFPELVNLRGDEVKRNYVAALRDTVLLNDVVARYAVKDVRLLDDVFAYLVNNASCLLSINNIANYLKGMGRTTSYETVAAYVGYIEDAFMAYRADRFNLRGRQVMAGVAKHYLVDQSYKNYVYPGYGCGVGHLLEGVVYIELLRRGFVVYVGAGRNCEVDFVAQKADRLLYLQVAYSVADAPTAEREYASLEAIDDNYEKWVVTLDDVQMASRRGIRHVRAWELGSALG